ncbi:M23 family metallopeptidase [Chelativorans intermedius]|uniref:M23 family metallopeptidase n=1 Tax=Chelativorans intermedius TaxID=515947 RepID=A0ABV6D508_9HYPH
MLFLQTGAAVKGTKGAGSSGRRKKPATIIIARGDDIRYFTVRPWMAAAASVLIAAASASYIAATAYWVMRDDLLGAAMARQVELRQTYEERIAVLRAELDRVTSRQLLDQQLMQRKMGELIHRQEELKERHARLRPVLERAAGLTGPEDVPVPSPRPDSHAAAGEVMPGLDGMTTATAFAATSRPSRLPWPIRRQTVEPEGAKRMFASITHTLNEMEAEQVARVETLAERAYRTAETIAEALAEAGIPLADDYGETNMGGPLIAAEEADFDDRVQELDEALRRLAALRQTARRVPIANPVPGAAVTSGFGMRRDPILRRKAYHSGIDFRARQGAPIRATGAGTVVSAGWNGGYGRMVEIDHGDGLTTRYAHLSRILVKPGETVEAGSLVGHAGSSGRSTGPHLHYEVRRDGRAIDPLTFISAGRRISDYL